jgi:ketosteroid isomerase-like protein
MKTSVLLALLALPIVLVVMSPPVSADGDSLQQQVVAKEREQLDALKTGDREAFASLLADDALFLDPHGHGTKAEVLEHTADLRLLEYTMEDIRFAKVSDKSGLIAYKLTEKVSNHGREFSAQVYASALWMERDGKWVCLFSQETPARQPR